MTDQEIKRIAEQVLTRDPSRAGFLGVDVQSDRDFDGDPVIRVTARYERMPQQARPLDGMHAIRTELLRLGEERIVFLTNKYDDELPAIDDDAA